MKNLYNLRKQIDAVDKDIISLLDRRLFFVHRIASIKNNDVNIPFTDLKREDEIIHRLQKQTDDPILQDGIADVYKILFTTSSSSLESAKFALTAICVANSST